MVNKEVGLHGDGGSTAVQADGGRDRDKWVRQFAGCLEGVWYERDAIDVLGFCHLSRRTEGHSKDRQCLWGEFRAY
jgi:hypothetical protein